jgi:phospholipase D1/2
MQDKFEEYIYFFSLRTHSLVNDIPTTELIYVHSKMMIVDDEAVLIGSANINDRSMLGSRDSEIAVIVKDNKKISSLMNGKPFQASFFAHSLRLRLFKEHLGYDIDSNMEDFLNDPLDEKFFKIIKEIAKSNSYYYKQIFNCYPDDEFLRFQDIPLIKKYIGEELEQLKERYKINKDKIAGNLVDFPLSFLKEELLGRSYFSKEILVPLKNFL